MLIRLLTLSLVFLAVELAATADVVVYNFDDGTNQGWTNVLTSTTPGGPTAYEASDRNDAALFPSHSGNFRALPQTPDDQFIGIEDLPHQTLVFRSPEFVTGTNASINFFLGIGTGGAAAPANFSSLPANSAGNGFLGVGIRRVSDGAYVLSARRASNGIDWEEFTFDTATLNASSLIGETLTLDLIDQHNGGFGWVALDTVTLNDVTAVPEPGTSALLAIAGLMGIGRRRRRHIAA